MTTKLTDSGQQQQKSSVWMFYCSLPPETENKICPVAWCLLDKPLTYFLNWDDMQETEHMISQVPMATGPWVS